jgi:hypothetical protein
VSVVGNVGDQRVVIGSQQSADKLQRVGCTPSTGANLILWHMRIPFHAICTFVFPRMIARCRVTRPPQANSHCDLFGPWPWLRVRRSARASFGPRAQSYLLSIHHHHHYHTPSSTTLDRAEYETPSATKSLQHSHSGGEKERIFPDRYCMHLGALYPAFLTCIAILSRHRPLLQPTINV